MSAPAPIVILQLSSRPQTLTLVRGMLAGIAELLALDPELLDDVKTAVSEAANNVVMHAYPDGPGPLEVRVRAATDHLEVVVRDDGAGIPEHATASDRGEGIGLPLIRALASEVTFARPAGARHGTEVRMRFAATRAGVRLFSPPDGIAAVDGFSEQLTGEAVASLSPVALLGEVMGRMARVLAANARFSLDRFSDIYLVTDAIASQASRAAATGRIAFSLQGTERRLELAVGPFIPGTGAALERRLEPHSFALVRFTDELTVESLEQGELLRATIAERDD